MQIKTGSAAAWDGRSVTIFSRKPQYIQCWPPSGAVTWHVPGKFRVCGQNRETLSICMSCVFRGCVTGGAVIGFRFGRAGGTAFSGASGNEQGKECDLVLQLGWPNLKGERTDGATLEKRTTRTWGSPEAGASRTAWPTVDWQWGRDRVTQPSKGSSHRRNFITY